MNKSEIYGKELPLEQLLICREERANRQKELLDKYALPLICFTLNIPGPVKRFPLADEGFFCGIELINRRLKQENITVKHYEYSDSPSGLEGYFIVNADPLAVKKVMTELEEKYACARIFDIDIIRVCSSKVSRHELGLEGRKCLLCNEPASVCARSRAHGLDAVIQKTVHLLRKLVYSFKASQISHLAVDALLEEVYTTPKPGLVDKNNSGSHSDMDVALFEKSARSLSWYFREIAFIGLHSENCTGALDGLRDIGMLAEEKMLEATGGVNTHKGAVFSMGIMCYCAGFLIGQCEKVTNENLQNVCKSVCCNVLNDFSDVKSKRHKTAGEHFFAKHKITGVRGEAHDGFPAVFHVALPYFRELLSKYSQNDAGCLTLLKLMSCVIDTNILHRGDSDSLSNMAERSCELIQKNVPFKELLPEIELFDDYMINCNLSPGGCADLLALTYFVHSLTEN